MEKYIQYLQDPTIQSLLALIGILISIYFVFQKARRPDYSFHKDRYELTKHFLEELKNKDERKLAIEELFSSLWNTNQIKYDEIEYLLNSRSPKYFIGLYVKSKGYLLLEDGKLIISKKYNKHLDGLKKEEKKIERRYYSLGVIFSILFSFLLTQFTKLDLSTLLFFIFLMSVCFFGMILALFEVRRVYFAQKMIDEMKL